MKRFLTSSLLTVVAVPFLMAAPAAKTQNQPKAADQKASTAKPKAHKVKKSKTAKTNTAAPTSSTPTK
jgi:hypothetical protein